MVSACLYVFLYNVCGGMMVAPMTELVLHRACKAHGLDEHVYCQEKYKGYDNAQRDAAKFVSTKDVMTGVAEFLTCALYGCLGDTYGRRLPLISPLFGSVCSWIAWGFLPASVEWDMLLVSLFICSLFGGPFVVFQSAFATVADRTQDVTPEQRAQMFGIIVASIHSGLTLGPVLGGVVGDYLGEKHAFFVPACIGSLNLLITVLTFGETLDEHRHKPFSWRRANSFAALSLFVETRTTMLLGVVMFITIFHITGGGSVLSLYMIKATNMQSSMLGFIQSLNVGWMTLGNILLMPMLVYCMKLHHIAGVSALSMTVYYLLMSVSVTEVQFLIVSTFCFPGSLVYAVVRTGIVNTFGHGRYGESLAAVGCLQQLATAVAPVIMPQIYVATENTVVHIGPVTVRCITLLVAALCGLVATTAAALVPGIPDEMESHTGAAIEMLSTDPAE